MTRGDERDGEIVVSVFGRTDVGRTREHNEDSFIVVDLSTNNASLEPAVRRHRTGPKGSLFMVADGMGGAAAGEIASAMAVEIVLSELRASWIGNANASGAQGFARALTQATRAANDQINAYASHHSEFRGMGTTATIAGLLGDTLYLAQVGDSRAYLVRGGAVQQITKDQSLMQKLIEAGELTEEEAEHSERRNIILQALGPEPTIKVDLTHQTVRRGDVLVLCSDGLSGQVTKDDIATAVRDEPELIDVCKRLIERANANGGPDNITVIVARFDGDGLQTAGAGDEVGHRVFALPDSGKTPVSVDAVSSRATPATSAPSPVSAPTPTAGAATVGDTPTSTPATPTPIADRTAFARLGFEPYVSPERRNVGRAVAVALLAILVIGATWLVVHSARSAAGPTTTTPVPRAP